MIYNDQTAECLSRKEVYSGGANYPTVVTEYACACGAGKIVTKEVSGFGDYTAEIQCEHCKRKYHVITGCGHLWELRERN